MTLQSVQHWTCQYERMLRWRDRVRGIEATDPAGDHLDLVLALLLNCYHLRDWLDSSGTVAAVELKNLFDGNEPLRLCRDICNGSKHFRLDRKSAFAGQFAFGVRIGNESPESGPKYLFTIFADGFKEIHRFGMIELAEQCVATWTNFLRSRGVIGDG